MFRRYASKLLRIVTMLAMTVQLGVFAYHHHDNDGAYGATTAYTAHIEHGAISNGDIDHDDHATDEHHHGPYDDEHHECDLCTLKTAFSAQLIPDASVVVKLFRTHTQPKFAKRDDPQRDGFTWRYLARAPPSTSMLS